jgi:hypothetical protein
LSAFSLKAIANGSHRARLSPLLTHHIASFVISFQAQEPCPTPAPDSQLVNSRFWPTRDIHTPRAHQLKKTFDWVVIYFDGRGGERQCTVITSAYGPLAGKRIIRGREPECMEHYLRPAARDVRSGKIQDAFSI